jgi:hypothetical protein
MGRGKSDEGSKAERKLSVTEWQLLHCVFAMAETGDERVTAVRLRERLALAPYHRNIEVNHVKVVLDRLEGAGWLTSTPIPREPGRTGRMEHSFRPVLSFEAAFARIARRFLDDLFVAGNKRAKAILIQLLTEDEPVTGEGAREDEVSPPQRSLRRGRVRTRL